MFETDTLIAQIRSLAEEDSDFVSLMANASALLNGALDRINWVGFYIARDGGLLLGPFQGKVACVRIPAGKGVCGAAAARRETVVVDDVHRFPGHIACDSASRSEIVIPLCQGGAVRAVLDIDSPVPGRFTPADREGLEALAALMEGRPERVFPAENSL